MGWDLNLDGIVDTSVSSSQGSRCSTYQSSWHVFQTPTTTHTTSIAFLATDANGGKDVALLAIKGAINRLWAL